LGIFFVWVHSLFIFIRRQKVGRFFSAASFIDATRGERVGA